jgi:hypothetical protein
MHAAKVAVKDGTLCLYGPGGELRLKLGENAATWSQKILHPKSRAEKLGLKAGCQVAVVNLSDVILARRTAGLKDVKLVSFSPTETALKFVRPLKS